MNLKQVNTQESEEQNLKINYLTFKGAQVMWPPDCPDDMLEEAISWAKNFSETCKVKSQGGNDGQMGGRNEGLRETDYYTVAEKLKREMDNKYKPYWHVVCGKNFGCYAIHESRHFIFFTLPEGVSFMLYKAS